MANATNSIIRGRKDGGMFFSTFFMGNTTVNATGNSVGFVLGGNVVVNSTMVAVGANVQISYTTLKIGNTTVNAVANSSTVVINAEFPLLSVANSTATANLRPSSLNIGANVLLNTTSLFIGNSTVNVAANSSQVTIGANLNITATALSVGNSTVNTTVNSSLLFTTGTIRAGAFTANTTATLVGFIDRSE